MVGTFGSRWTSFLVLGLISGPLLAGCGGSGQTVQEALGYQQAGPDEMSVIKRPPLIVPPDYNLRPPRADDQNANSEAASDTARKTLIGPSSSVASESSEARAILTGTTPENDTADAASEGQNILLSRTNRAELDLDNITETRAESRVDTALLRRLLAWTPPDQTATEGGDEADAEIVETVTIVEVISRSQTVTGDAAAPNQANTE